MAHPHATVLPLPAAAALLRLPPAALEALVGSGYLVPRSTGPEGPEFRLADLKAFVARNADESGDGLMDLEEALGDVDQVDPQELLDALDSRSAEMARRVYDVFSTVFPDAAAWSMREQARFIEQAKARFEAILAVTGQGSEVDEALSGDLEEVGARAARAGSPLPRLLVILRASRDLVVQTAVELAEEHGRHWGLPLSLLLSRVLPAMDRLTDALAQGYWAAILSREGEERARFEHLVEHAPEGIFDVDLDGRVHFVNPALARTLGREADDLLGVPLFEVMRPAHPSATLASLFRLCPGRDGRGEPGGVEETGAGARQGSAGADSGAAAGWQRLTTVIVRPDGERRVLTIHTLPRRSNGEVVGFQGIVRDEDERPSPERQAETP